MPIWLSKPSALRACGSNGGRPQTWPFGPSGSGGAPIDAPRYAVGVVIEHGSHGATTAAPVGRDILLKIQEMAANKTEGGSAPPPEENKEEPE